MNPNSLWKGTQICKSNICMLISALKSNSKPFFDPTCFSRRPFLKIHFYYSLGDFDLVAHAFISSLLKLCVLGYKSKVISSPIYLKSASKDSYWRQDRWYTFFFNTFPFKTVGSQSVSGSPPFFTWTVECIRFHSAVKHSSQKRNLKHQW